MNISNFSEFQNIIKKYKVYNFETVFSKSQMHSLYLDYVKEIANRKIEFGIKAIDDALGGIRPAQLVTTIAATNTGKTAFALNVGYHVVNKSKYNVIFFSCEASEIDVYERFLQIHTNKSTYQVEDLYLKRDKDYLLEAENLCKKYDRFITVVKRINIDEIQPYCLAIEELTGNRNGLIIVDHQSLIKNDRYTKEYDRTTDNMSKLREIGLNLKTPILNLSQTNRVNSAEEKLTMYSGKGSGEIENSSNIVLTLSRRTFNSGDEYYLKYKSFFGDEIMTRAFCDKPLINILELETKKKKQGENPETAYLIFDRKTTKLTEFIKPKALFS